jgi:2-keto-4-pentenoate hydratase/2-oxohepta-3-ene-1,7-dioic acid hydratase in catechol pathway
MGEEVPQTPLTFFKPNTSVIGPGEPIIYRRPSREVSYEGELAVVIGRICKEVPVARVPEVIFGYTVANDVTARDLQADRWAVGTSQGLRHVLSAWGPGSPHISSSMRLQPLRFAPHWTASGARTATPKI